MVAARARGAKLPGNKPARTVVSNEKTPVSTGKSSRPSRGVAWRRVDRKLTQSAVSLTPLRSTKLGTCVERVRGRALLLGGATCPSRHWMCRFSSLLPPLHFFRRAAAGDYSHEGKRHRRSFRIVPKHWLHAPYGYWRAWWRRHCYRARSLQLLADRPAQLSSPPVNGANSFAVKPASLSSSNV